MYVLLYIFVCQLSSSPTPRMDGNKRSGVAAVAGGLVRPWSR